MPFRGSIQRAGPKRLLYQLTGELRRSQPQRAGPGRQAAPSSPKKPATRTQTPRSWRRKTEEPSWWRRERDDTYADRHNRRAIKQHPDQGLTRTSNHLSASDHSHCTNGTLQSTPPGRGPPDGTARGVGHPSTARGGPSMGIDSSKTPGATGAGGLSKPSVRARPGAEVRGGRGENATNGSSASPAQPREHGGWRVLPTVRPARPHEVPRRNDRAAHAKPLAGSAGGQLRANARPMTERARVSGTRAGGTIFSTFPQSTLSPVQVRISRLCRDPVCPNRTAGRPSEHSEQSPPQRGAQLGTPSGLAFLTGPVHQPRHQSEDRRRHSGNTQTDDSQQLPR